MFTHVNGATGQYYLPEMMGAGVALFDYDNDGDLDVFLVQSGALDGGRERSRRLPPVSQRSDGRARTAGERCASPT